MQFYVASKTKHAPMWQELRAAGVPVLSTWIDEAGEDQTVDYAELAERCVREILVADAVLLYCEPGEILKGALVEVGAALAAGKEVRCVGECDTLSRVFCRHPAWREFPTMAAAIGG